MEDTFNVQMNSGVGIKTSKEYENEIQILKNENFDLKAKINHLFTKGGSLDKEPHDTQRRINEYQNMIQNLSKENARFKSELVTLRSENGFEESRNQIRQLEAKNLELENQNLQLREICEGLSKDKEDIMCLYRKVQENNDSLNKKLISMQEMNEGGHNRSPSGMADDKNTVISQSRIRINELEKQVSVLNENLGKGIEGYSVLLSNFNKLTSEYDEKVKEVQYMNKELQYMKEEINRKSGERAQMHDNIQDLVNQIKNLERNNEETLERFENIENRYKEMAELNHELQVKYEDLELDFNTLERERNSLENRLEEIVQEKEDLKGLKDKLEKTCDSRLDALKSLQSENKFLQKDKNELKFKLEKSFTDSIQNVSNCKISQLEEENVNFVKTLKAKNNEITETRRIINLYKTFQSNYNTAIQRLIQKIDFIGKKVEKNSYTYKKCIEKYKKNIRKCRMHVKELKKENKSLKTRYDHKLKNLKPINMLETKNYSSLIQIVGSEGNMDHMVQRIVFLYKEMIKRINSLESEVKNAEFFAKNGVNNKYLNLKKFFDQFTTEFKEARKELNQCKEYLIKKSKEIKKIKQEKKQADLKIKEFEEKYLLNKNDLKENKNNFINPFAMLKKLNYT